MKTDPSYVKRPGINLHRFVLWFLFPSLILLTGCASTARFPDNPPLERAVQQQPRVTTAAGENNLLLVLSFSGGGSRASALAYGVLEGLAETQLPFDATRRMLDEVDMITAVSGGSITAAYYGLFGDRIFSRFRKEFLDVDVENDLKHTLLAPATLSRLMIMAA